MNDNDAGNFGRTPSAGPLYTAILSAVVAAGQLVALFMGMRIDMTMVLAVIVPAVVLAVVLVAVSMGWIFVLIGRLHRNPAKLPVTVAVLGITLVEVGVIIVICAQASPSRG
jgi:hypothetical protein